MKKLATITLGIIFSTIVLAAGVFTELFRWEQPTNASSALAIPFRGGLTLLDQKRAKDEVQWVWFQADLGQFFQAFPQEHMFVLVDGELEIRPGRDVPYGARGIAMFKDRICIEQFATQELSACTPLSLTYSSGWFAVKYDIIVHASEDYVAYWVRDASHNTIVYNASQSPDLLRGISNISLIVIGATGDGVSYSAPLLISDVKQGRFTIK